MASLSNDPGGTRRITLTCPDGKRRSVRLGKVPKKTAEELRGLIERLASAAVTGSAPAGGDVHRVADLPDLLHAKLAKTGIVAPRESADAATLGPFLDDYLARRAPEVKDATIRHLREAAAFLVAFYGADADIRGMTPADADRFRSHLLASGLAANSTVPRRIGRPRQLFKAAVRAEVIDRNLFDGLTATVRSDDARRYHLLAADSARILATCPPGSRWPLVFSLLRWAGLRCPSELAPLTWDDVHWPDPSADNGRDRTGWLRVTSPKTEHHEGKGHRILPLFPEILAPLRAAFDAAEPGATAVLPELPTAPVLRRQFLAIVERAGLSPWPRLFHNLRATRETELSRESSEHVGCAWIGNTLDVARKHYMTVTDDDFAEAARENGGAPSGARAARNSARRVPADSGTGLHPGREKPTPAGWKLVRAASCRRTPVNGMPRRGLE
ncbi:MAG: hypothetical protein AAF907_09270, partial [Planctomycetota bacterium]